MLAIEVFIVLLAVFLIIAFAVLVNPPNALVNFFGGKKKKDSKE